MILLTRLPHTLQTFFPLGGAAFLAQAELVL
jgi:ureidoglycolate hydrolase